MVDLNLSGFYCLTQRALEGNRPESHDGEGRAETKSAWLPRLAPTGGRGMRGRVRV